MKTATTVIQVLVRLSGLVMIVLGLLFWTRNAMSLLPVHMLLGLALVLMLWALAAMAARVRVHPGLIALAVVWGLVLPVFGMTQSQILPGSAHWVIQLLHLVVGIAALGIAENLAVRIKRALAGDPRQSDGSPVPLNSR